MTIFNLLGTKILQNYKLRFLRVGNWDHFQEELDHQRSNEYQFWLLNHHNKLCCCSDDDMAFLKYGFNNISKIWLIPCWIFSTALLVIVIMSCSSIPETIGFKIKILKVHTFIENQFEECCCLGEIVSQTFTFLTKCSKRLK